MVSLNIFLTFNKEIIQTVFKNLHIITRTVIVQKRKKIFVQKSLDVKNHCT